MHMSSLFETEVYKDNGYVMQTMYGLQLVNAGKNLS